MLGSAQRCCVEHLNIALPFIQQTRRYPLVLPTGLRNARAPTSPRRIYFCVIWGCTSPSPMCIRVRGPARTPPCEPALRAFTPLKSPSVTADLKDKARIPLGPKIRTAPPPSERTCTELSNRAFDQRPANPPVYFCGCQRRTASLHRSLNQRRARCPPHRPPRGGRASPSL